MIRKINYKEELVVLKENKVYRISDLFFKKGDRWKKDRQSILRSKKYKDTILYDYLKLKKREKDYPCLQKVIRDHVKRKGYSVPTKDELVIHIRLGDAIGDCLATYRKTIDLYSNLYKKINMDLKKISKISIVTALHFGSNELNGRCFYDPIAETQSIKILKDIEKQTNELGYSLNLVSNENIDKDVCYMANASWFIPSISRFSTLLSSCLYKSSFTNNAIVNLAKTSNKFKIK